MSVEKAVLTAHAVSQKELANLVAPFGGSLLSPEIVPGIYYLNEGHLQISLDMSTLYEFSQEKDLLELITTQLGSPPQSVILISVIGTGGEDEAFKLSLKICIAIARQWGAVVDNLMADDYAHIYTLSDLEKMESKAGTWTSDF